MKNEYGNVPAVNKKIQFLFDELSFIIKPSFFIELPSTIELPLISQLSFTIELSSMPNEYANFPAFGRDFSKISLLFLTSCP